MGRHRSPGPAPASTPAPDVRWALTRATEETGRHAGHAGTLRTSTAARPAADPESVTGRLRPGPGTRRS
ncbi:mycothiol transferase [Streptomyces sp. AHA2]|uniref:mycothiol transferase n=1 Tax=Streptomyces sp. AHA2 TaxID=3064526 RepID=UPI002FE0606C